jgi:hypothetical protein
MLIKVPLKKSKVSSWGLSFFALTLIVAAFCSDFFQAPIVTTQELNKFRLLMDSQQVNKIESFSIKNRLGEFQLQREADRWKLISPRDMPADPVTIGKILESLKKIKIRKIFQIDPINISNYSLDAPLIEFNLGYPNQKKQNLKIGLINPIDNSTYITTSENDAIYHVDSLEHSLEKFNLSDLIDSKIFAQNNKTVKEVKIFRGHLNSKNLQLKLVRTGADWQGKSQKLLQLEKVEKYLDSLFSLKSLMILDKVSENLKIQIDKKLRTPLYTIIVKDNSDNEVKFIVSSLINQLPDLKLEKRKNFLISASDRSYSYILSKENLVHFSKTQKKLKQIPIKKLFY